jgi:DNA polymerase-1
MSLAHIVPTIHPAYLFKSSRPYSDTVALDIQKAARISAEGPTPEGNYVIVHPTNPSGLETAVREARAWMQRWRMWHCPVAVDVESSSLKYYSCKLYSIALSGLDQFCASTAFTLSDLHTIPWEAEQILTAELAAVLADENVEKVYHNAPFDMAVLRKKGYVIRGPIFDTQSAHHLVQPDIPHTLDWVGHTYLDVEPWKLDHEGKKQAFTKDIVELLVYNAQDARNTVMLKNPLVQEIYERGMSQGLIQHQMRFSWLATQMELVGIPIDQAERRRLGNELMLRLELLKHRMQVFLNWADFNPRSPDHKIEALYGPKFAKDPYRLGFRVEKTTPKKQDPMTGREALLDYLEHPFVKDLVEYNEGTAAYGTMFKDSLHWKEKGGFSKAIEDDGRLHVAQKPTAQKGTRFGTSPNVQNIPAKYRTFIAPKPGWVLVGSDKDQLELRIICCYAGVPRMVQEMNKPEGDPHLITCNAVYGDYFWSLDKKKQGEVRTGVKNVTYNSIYRGGIDSVHLTIRKNKFVPTEVRASLTRDVVAHIYHGLFGAFPEIGEYHDVNFAHVEQYGFDETQTLLRRRYFKNPPPFTEVANWRTQTEGSDIVTVEMCGIQEELDWRFNRSGMNAFIIIHGHDQVVIECRDYLAEQVVEVVKRRFGRTVIQGPVGSVPLTAGVSVAKTFKEAK